MFTLASPAWLVLLPLWLSTLWLSRLSRQRRGVDDFGRAAITLVHPQLGGVLDTAPQAIPRHTWLDQLAIPLLIFALAQPQWIGTALPDTPDARELVLVTDLSLTMSIRDFELDGAPVDRLAVLKGLTTRFVEARRGDRVGVIAFGRFAATLVPPTFDQRLVIAVLDRMQAGVAGDETAIGDALGLALKQLRADPRVRPALILFTDGANTAGDMTLQEAAELARRMAVPVYAVQIGGDAADATAPAAPTDEPTLPQLASLTGGRYYTAATTTALRDVLRDIDALEKSVTRPSGLHDTREWYLLPLLLAVLLLTFTRLRRMA